MVEDNVSAVVTAVREAFRLGMPAEHRSTQVERYLAQFASVDATRQLSSSEAAVLLQDGGEQ
jgi:hypothetical protein